MKKYLHIFITLPLAMLLLFIAPSCETTEKIDEFPLRPSQLVVNCFFVPDSTWEFQVSKSLSVLDNAELKLVSDAEIFLFKDSTPIDTIRTQDADGYYRSNQYLPKKNENYSIEVSAPGFNTPLIAEGVVPADVPVINASVRVTDSAYFYKRHYEWGEAPSTGNIEGILEFTFKDPPGVANYYQLSLYGYSKEYDYTDSTIHYIYRREINYTIDDPVAEKSEEYYGVARFTDELIDGQTYKLKLDFRDWEASRDQEYIIELISLNRDSYMYRRSVQEYRESNGDPFSEPVLIYSNIKNGYGIFAGHSKYIYRVKVFGS